MREERKVVTVLFADLVGFTGRSERLDPEEIGRILAMPVNTVWSHLQRANEAAKEQLLFALRVTGIHVRYLQQRPSEVEQKTISLPPERSE